MSITGSQVADIKQVIQRKLDGERFGGIILDAFSRFARNEADAARLYADCIDAELLIVTVKEGLLMGAGSWAKRGAAVDQSEGYTRDSGRNSNRGVARRITDELVSPSMRMPYGCDRIYYDQNDKPMFRLSTPPDGRRAIHDPDAPYAIRYYIPANETRFHLRRDQEWFQYAPSIHETRNIMKMIFELFYEEGLRRHRICAILNGQSIRTRKGNEWASGTIDKLINNPVYVGFSAGCVTTTGAHSKRRKDSPDMHPMPRRPGMRKNKKGPRKRIPAIYRPPIEWMISEQPLMKDSLSGISKEKAVAEWERKKVEGWLPTLPKRQFRASAPNSSYFLAKLLKTADGVPMVGDGYQNGEKRYRYYRTARHKHKPSPKRPNERVRAELIENEIKAGLAMILTDTKSLDSEISTFIREYQRDLLSRGKDTLKLREEKSSLETWYRSTFSAASGRGQKLLEGESQRVEKRLDEIDNLLAAAKSDMAIIEEEIPEIVSSIKAQFSGLTLKLENASGDAMRTLASIFVSRAVFDAHSRAVNLEFALPAAMIARQGAIAEAYGLGKTLDFSSIFQRKSPNALHLLSISCSETHVKRSPCFTCSRVQRLAA